MASYLKFIFFISLFHFCISKTCPDKATECANRNTCCPLTGGRYGCCPFPNAVCCSDHSHCCPSGSKCDVRDGVCFHGHPFTKLITEKQEATAVSDYSFLNEVDAPEVTISNVTGSPCPDHSVCPGHSTCCLTAHGGYGCCPYQLGVCCSDLRTCCPHGKECHQGGYCY